MSRPATASGLSRFLMGAALSLVVNLGTIAGWFLFGPFLPSAANVLLALLILGFYGLEDQWAFPLGYWAVELLAIVGWINGLGMLTQLTAG